MFYYSLPIIPPFSNQGWIEDTSIFKFYADYYHILPFKLSTGVYRSFITIPNSKDNEYQLSIVIGEDAICHLYMNNN